MSPLLSPARLPTERYQAAADATAVKLGAKLAGIVAHGYWIDDQRYFHALTEMARDRDGNDYLTVVPRIADARNGEVRTVLSGDAIAAAIAAETGKPFEAVSLAAAEYDMIDPDTLVVGLMVIAYHIAIDRAVVVKVEAIDPAMSLYSPDGAQVCVRKDYGLWLRNRKTGELKALSPEGEANYGYGCSPESGISPIEDRALMMPCGLWSADSEWLATHRIDERALPESGLVENAPAGGKRPVLHRYKVAGPEDELPTVEYLAFHIPTGRTLSTASHLVRAGAFTPFAYRCAWFAGDGFYYVDMNRTSSEVALMKLDLGDGSVRTVLSEKADSGWIDLHPFVIGQPMIRHLAATNELIWFSEADGWGHLYLHDASTGTRKNRITGGEWMVREIVHVDEARRRVLFLASGFDGSTDLGDRRLCAIRLDGTGFEELLTIDGDIGVGADPVSTVDQIKPFRPSYAPYGVSPDGRYAVASLGRADIPTRVILVDLESRAQVPLAEVDIASHWTAPTPIPFEALAADGVTRLFGAMYFPTGFDPAKRYPLVDYIYPGPQVNWYIRRFPNLIASTLQSVVEAGMVGIIVESRGLPNRNRAFHQAGSGRMHEPQIGDHAAVIAQLCDRHPFLDRDRVGIFGQSGGGYATARAMFDYPDTFRAGVAICGNHDNRNYISAWIDKYGGRPGTPDYSGQSNTGRAHKLKGKLFLIHGDMDDNVHVGHSLAVSAALISAGKDFDQLIVPGGGHGILFESPYVLQRVWSYFVRHLLGVEPPADFSFEYTLSEGLAAKRMMKSDLG